MPPLSATKDCTLVNKLDCGPHRDGGEGVEDLLHSLVQFTDVLDLHSGVGYFKCSGQV